MCSQKVSWHIFWHGYSSSRLWNLTCVQHSNINSIWELQTKKYGKITSLNWFDWKQIQIPTNSATEIFQPSFFWFREIFQEQISLFSRYFSGTNFLVFAKKFQEQIPYFRNKFRIFWFLITCVHRFFVHSISLKYIYQSERRMMTSLWRHNQEWVLFIHALI